MWPTILFGFIKGGGINIEDGHWVLLEEVVEHVTSHVAQAYEANLVKVGW